MTLFLVGVEMSCLVSRSFDLLLVSRSLFDLYRMSRPQKKPHGLIPERRRSPKVLGLGVGLRF